VSRVFILVEGEEPSLGAESFQDTPGMAATAEGAVYVTAIRSDLQSVERFRQQNREVVGALVPGGGTGFLVDRWCQGRSPPGFITCLARLLNASGEKDSKN